MASLDYWLNGLDARLGWTAILLALPVAFALLTASALVITSRRLANVSELLFTSIASEDEPLLMIDAELFRIASRSQLATTRGLSFANTTAS